MTRKDREFKGDDEDMAVSSKKTRKRVKTTKMTRRQRQRIWKRDKGKKCKLSDKI